MSNREQGSAVPELLVSERLACYHCGLEIPEGVDLQVSISGQNRRMCCEGCRAVAEAIVANGLEAYYSNRDSLPESPREARPDILDSLSLYDQVEFQKTFVRALGEHEQEAALVLEGITCAACVWLNEQHVARLPGVLAAEVIVVLPCHRFSRRLPISVTVRTPSIRPVRKRLPRKSGEPCSGVWPSRVSA